MPKAGPKFLFIAAMLMLLVNYPILSAANVKWLIAGIPILHLYIGSVWLLGILVLFFAVRRHQRAGNE